MKTRISKVILSILFVANFLMITPSVNACAPGESSGVSVNATTGEQITYCIPAAPAPGVDYNPQTNPSAPPAETVLTREQAAQQRREYEAAAAAAAAIERDRIAASTPVVPRVIDPSDPLPTIASGEKVPGTVVSGQQEITCPAGSGRGIEVNATTGAVSTSCIKNFVPQAELDARALQDSQIKTAQEEAKKLSEEWNTANPGKQKCFSYSIGNQSGGVCANPVKVVTEEQITVTTKTPLPTILVDPFPTVSNGQVVPGTKVSGQKEITCPAGSGRGIEVNATSGAVSTSCIKSWISPEVILQQIAVEESINKSKLAALELSKIWNAENPGQQKCFSYGVVSQTTQLTESGAVCANPITNSLNSEIIEVIQSSSPTGTTNVNNVAIPKVLVLGNEDNNYIRVESDAKSLSASAVKSGAKTVKLAVSENEVGIKEIALPEKLIGYTIKLTENKKVISSIKLGSTTYTSEGNRITNLGITSYNSNGSSKTTLGSTTYFSSGMVSTKIGSTTYQSNGLTSQQIGTTTYFSDGQLYQSLK
jgi:hypothetical protein